MRDILSKKVRLFTTAFVLVALFSGTAFSQNNSIITRVYTEAVEESEATSAEKQISIQYFDGLGRPVQSVQVGASADGNDIVQHIAYDGYGRESKRFLSYAAGYAGGYFRENAEGEQLSFYSSSVPDRASDTKPWSTIEFEESPLNRVLQQGAPGTTWQAQRGYDSDKSVHFAYETNNTDEVILFEVDANGNLTNSGYYERATTYKNATRDENGVWSAEYKDQLGQVVLKVSDTTDLKLKTCYVYDDFGLLRYVIPPKAVNLIITTGIVNSDILSNLCYSYKYDYRNRMITKKIPGADPVYMVYDSRDRLVLTQDGNLRGNSEWMFTKYDRFNRPVITGIYYDITYTGQENMQNYLNSEMTSIFTESIDNNYTGTYLGYTNQCFPILGINDIILTATYYDNYNFDDNGALQTYCKSIDNIDYPISEINLAVKGQVTGSKIRILGTDSLITSIIFYDKKYRPLRSYSENPLLNKSDLVLSKYDFVGNVLETWQIHEKAFNTSIPFNDTISIKQWFEYDHAMRLTHEYHKVGSNPKVLISHNEYNELGQLIQKDIHGTSDTTYLQNVNFEYNIRGWLTQINKMDDLQQEGQAKDLFAMELAYDNASIGENGTAQYNGNISAMRWIDDKYNETQAYVFQYDNVNRLQEADHQTFNSGWCNTLSFDLALVDYDKNGNIKQLKRYSEGETVMDDMTYAYYNSNNSNQLYTVSDIGEDTVGFKDLINTVDYEYDANGNMIKDRNKGIDTVIYNYLNLPEQIIGGTDTISYFYTANGTKIAKVNANRIIKQYIGNLVYDEDSLDYILTSEGMVKVANANTFTYEYFLKDHLGNTRVAFYDSSNIAAKSQVNHYYPFGMSIAAYAFSSQTDNKYKYNGKELQDDAINGTKLDWYDYGARFYDAALGRFHTLDPLAENFSQQSPFVYADNNPIRFIDFMGMNADDFYFTEEGNLLLYEETDEPDNVYIFRDEGDGMIDVDKVEMSDEEIGEKMNDNGYKKVTKEEKVVETDVTTVYGEGEGAPDINTITSRDKTLEVKTMYTKKDNQVTDVESMNLARVDDQPKTLFGKIMKQALSPGVQTRQYIRKKTYSYGKKKKEGSQGAVNTGLKIIKMAEDLFFDGK